MSDEVLSFLGGTGPEGLGLAMRLAMTGAEVIIGSRSRERAEEAVEKLRAQLPHAKARGVENVEAAKAGEIVFVTFPFEGQREILPLVREHVSGKTLVSTVVPMKMEKGKAKAIGVEEGSAAEQAQKMLPEARVVSAFQNISAEKLRKLGEPLECDVLVCSDHPQAKKAVMELAQKIPNIRAVDGGALENSRYVEELTVLLVNINRLYRARTSIKLVGI